MSSRPVIAIDIDDTIADSTESLRQLVNRRWNVHLTKDDYRIPGNYRKYYEQVWARHGLVDKVKYADLEDEMVIDQSHVPLMEGAEEAIGELKKIAHVIFITARHVSWEAATRKWFSDVLAHNDIELYFSEGMSNTGAMTKGQLCKEFGASWLIDDNPSHCLTAIDEGVNTILFGEYGWHIGDGLQKMVKCKSWPDVTEYFRYESR